MREWVGGGCSVSFVLYVFVYLMKAKKDEMLC